MANSLGLIQCDTCLDGIGQHGTWHETDDGYWWILFGMVLSLVASTAVLLIGTRYLCRLDSRRVDSL